MIISGHTTNPVQCKDHKNKNSILLGTIISLKSYIIPGKELLLYKYSSSAIK